MKNLKSIQKVNISICKRKAYKGLLPNYILNHHKTGWRFSTDEILIGRREQPAPDKGILKDYIIEILKDKELQDLFEYNDLDIHKKYLNNKEFQDERIKPKKQFTIRKNCLLY